MMLHSALRILIFLSLPLTVSAQQSRWVVEDKRGAMEVYAEFDPNLPEWFVRKDGEGYQSLRQRVNDYSAYRIVYAAPAANGCAGLKDAPLIIHGDLPARTISAYDFR